MIPIVTMSCASQVPASACSTIAKASAKASLRYHAMAHPTRNGSRLTRAMVAPMATSSSVFEEAAIVVLALMVPAPGRKWRSWSATAATTTAFGVWTAIIGSVWLPTQTDVPAGTVAQVRPVISSALRVARTTMTNRIGNTMSTEIMNSRVEAVRRSASNTILPVSEHLSLLERAMAVRIRSLISASTKLSIPEETEIAAWVWTAPVLVPLSSSLIAMTVTCGFGIMIPMISSGSRPTIIAVLRGLAAALAVGSNSSHAIRAAARNSSRTIVREILSLIAPIFACSTILRTSEKP
mmetsp:Transcript_18573/g.53321  ORF Transcript_18573/g.53321 Transcript_18573/m.53321 type:complete len:295 (+) Transcript_18573:1285-2169(+)